MKVKINTQNEFEGIISCPIQCVLAVNDTLGILKGKWKLPVIAALLFDIKSFTGIRNTIPEITPKMLSKVLKELEVDGVVKRTVQDPALIEYELTESGKTIKTLLENIIDWGLQHRNAVFSEQ